MTHKYNTLEAWLASEEYQQEQQRFALKEQLLANRLNIAAKISALHKTAVSRGFAFPEEVVKARELGRKLAELDRQWDTLKGVANS